MWEPLVVKSSNNASNTALLTQVSNMPNLARHNLITHYCDNGLSDTSYDFDNESVNSPTSEMLKKIKMLMIEVKLLKSSRRGRTRGRRRSKSTSCAKNAKDCEFCLALGYTGEYCKYANNKKKC